MNKKVFILFCLVSLLTLFINVLLSYLFNQNFFETLKTRREELIKVAEYQDFLTHLVDAETGERGYVITGNPNYLEPYNKAVRYFNSPKTQQFIQREDVSGLMEKAQAKLKQLSEINAIREKDGFDAAANIVFSGTGKELMDLIRQMIESIITSKEGSLGLLESNIQNKMRDTTKILLVTNLLSSLLIGLCLYSIYRSMQKIEAKDRELSLAYNKLHETSAMNQAILNSSNYAIISTDPQGTITSFNPAAERMLGYSREEIVGKTTPHLFHSKEEIENRAIQLSKELNRLIYPGFEVFVTLPREGIPDTQEWTFGRKNGTRFPALLTVTAIKHANGKIVGFVGFVNDITERKEIERMKNDLISITSYELQSPVVAIKGTFDLLSQEELQLPEQANKIIELGKKTANGFSN